LKLRNVSPQVIVTKLFDAPLMPSHCIDQRFTHNPAFLAVREFKMAGSTDLVDLAETVGASRKPTKAIEFSPQVTQFFNIIGFLEFFRSFYGTFRGVTGDFRTFLEKFRKDF